MPSISGYFFSIISCFLLYCDFAYSIRISELVRIYTKEKFEKDFPNSDIDDIIATMDKRNYLHSKQEVSDRLFHIKRLSTNKKGGDAYFTV